MMIDPFLLLGEDDLMDADELVRIEQTRRKEQLRREGESLERALIRELEEDFAESRPVPYLRRLGKAILNGLRGNEDKRGDL